MTTNLTPKTPIDKKRLNLRYMRDKDAEMVKGIFRFHEVPGGCMSFSFKKYKEDEVQNYELHDGQVYTIPRGVATHLNKNVSYPIHGHLTDEDGKPKMKIRETVRRCTFQSLDFMDLDEHSNVNIIEASGV